MKLRADQREITQSEGDLTTLIEAATLPEARELFAGVMQLCKTVEDIGIRLAGARHSQSNPSQQRKKIPAAAAPTAQTAVRT